MIYITIVFAYEKVYPTPVMAKKTFKKDSRRKKDSVRKVTREANDPEPGEEKKFDFGGLPDRDLKKNLGCG